MSVPSLKAHAHAARCEGTWLTALPGHWIDAARDQLSRHAALVRVTLTALRGSAPREPGACLLVHALATAGTIGGGRLEWHATARAREMLLHPHSTAVRIDDLVLGPELGQCCGGRVELWLERLTRADLPWLSDASRRLREHPSAGTAWVLASELAGGALTHRLLQRPFATTQTVELKRSSAGGARLLEVLRQSRPQVWIFGAGHVGQALVRLLAELALFEITWIDSRAELLPAGLPQGVTAQICARPSERVLTAPAGTRFVVLTHDHALDYELCRLILTRADSAWLGLIGSDSKAARFRSRLLRDGLDRPTIARLTCPIGVPGIPSKLPGAIAIAIAAQLLQQGEAQPPAPSVKTDLEACTGDCGSCSRPNS